ncbi:P-loop NTPase fold protein [uncultured Mailhella sp.]|uniref:KAP family P-loop NTPase fold protein n=1 Tax=uncultured Mailhella sp. TaxID=1981031 RepID=UPI0025E88C34|nr:P-loop NTPase fold protein [uncultured Mailhella sp.]
MAKTCLVDVPIASKDNDQLEVGVYVDALKEFLEEADTPLTIAIQGEWGSGKTSFMNQLSEELCMSSVSKGTWPDGGRPEEAPYFGIWVHAWEYALLSAQTNILVGLMSGIIREIRAEVGRYTSDNSNVNKFCQRALDITKKLATATCYVAAAYVGVPGESVGGVLGGRNREEENEVDISELKQALREAISAGRAALPKKKGFIFFVDDLDRLDPVIAVNFLELLKNIFDLPKCIFVLAIDYDVVVRGLKPRFGERTEKNDREFRSFFDKIIQMPFTIPMSDYNLRNYLDESLRSIGFLTEEEECTLIPLKGAGDFSFSSETGEKSRERFAMDILVYLTECSVKNNPRSIKRLMNLLSLLDKIQRKKSLTNQKPATEYVSDTGRVTEKVILYALVCLQVAYPSIYEFLATNPAFTMWNEDDAVTQGYKRLTDEENEFLNKEDSPYEQSFSHVIYQLCRNDPYLKFRSRNILGMFQILGGIILSSDHRKLFGTEQIDNIKLIEKYDLTMLYENPDGDENADEGPLQDLSEQEKEDLWSVLHNIIFRALDKFLSISGMTSVESGSATPARQSEPRTYTRQTIYDSLEEYEKHLSEGFEVSLKLFREVKNKLDEIFGQEFIQHEYKEDGTINVRPVYRRKGKGQPPVFLSCVPMKKSVKKRLKITCGDETLYLADSIEPLLGEWPQLIDYFNAEISSKSVALPSRR